MTLFSSLKTILNHPNNRNDKVVAIGKIVWWQLNRIFVKEAVLVQITKSRKLICYPDSSYGSFVFYTKEPEYLELDFLKKYLDKNDVFIDVGSHIGHYAVAASEKISTGKIIAFEPTPSSFTKINENFRLNDILNIAVSEQVALSNKKGSAQFSINQESEVNSLATTNSTKSSSIKVRLQTLDEYATKHAIKRIDLIKIDTEGTEVDVLDGAKKLIAANKIKTLLFELNPKTKNYKNNTKKIFSQLVEAGYSFYTEQNDRWKKISSSDIKPANTINVLAVCKDSRTKSKIRAAIK